MKTTRLSFIRGSLGVCASGLLFAGCGGGSSSTDNTPNNTPSNNTPTKGTACTTSISANHGHVMSVAMADVDAGVEKTYDIHGTATHSHTVTLSADQFTTLKSASVTVTSSTTLGHSHDVEMSC